MQAANFERFIDNILVGDGCWEWTGKRQAGKMGYLYGRLSTLLEDGKAIGTKAHRLSYEHFVGPIPEGLVVDHTCQGPYGEPVTRGLCVSPYHLEPVSQRENIRRGTAPWAVMERTGKCRRGHDVSDAIPQRNRAFAGRGYRQCRTCLNDAKLASYHRLRKEGLASGAIVPGVVGRPRTLFNDNSDLGDVGTCPLGHSLIDAYRRTKENGEVRLVCRQCANSRNIARYRSLREQEIAAGMPERKKGRPRKELR